MPWGNANMPAPKLATSRPDELNFSSGATVDPSHVAPPQRSNTHTDLPSRSMSMPDAAPSFRPFGSWPNGSSLYGFGSLLDGSAPTSAAIRTMTLRMRRILPL